MLKEAGLRAVLIWIGSHFLLKPWLLLLLQAAVPKFMQLKLDPASGSALPPNGAGSVTQALHITNSMHGQKPLVMRLRLAYTLGDQQVTEQAEVSGFPAGY